MHTAGRASQLSRPRCAAAKPARCQAVRASAAEPSVSTSRRAAALRLLALPVLLASPLAARASDLVDDDDTNLATNSPLVLAAIGGISVGIGAPILFSLAEKRDKERIEEIRELNRATLKATGTTLSEEEIATMRKTRYLDRREFQDDD